MHHGFWGFNPLLSYLFNYLFNYLYNADPQTRASIRIKFNIFKYLEKISTRQ